MNPSEAFEDLDSISVEESELPSWKCHIRVDVDELLGTDTDFEVVVSLKDSGRSYTV